MGSERSNEIERKFDVDEATILPDLAGLQGGSTVSQPSELHLEAVYFDTSDLDLARQGVTLRRRTGGEDAGWHVKLPRGADARSELRWPLGRATRTVPKDVLSPVRALVRDRRLVPIARVSTRRLEYRLLAEDDSVLAHLCDDHVSAERLHGDELLQQWREWEVELDGAELTLLDVVEQRFHGLGVTRSSTGSKLRRSLGDAAPAVPTTPSRKQLAGGSAAQAVTAYLSAQRRELHRQDARLRDAHPSSVHQLRIAARRLRAALKTYAPLLEPEPAARLGEELRWLGRTLGDARDAQVLRERLLELVAAEPDELVLGPVVAQIDQELLSAEHSGREKALDALDSERYFRLLDALDELVTPGAFTPDAEAPARKVLPGLLRRDAKRLRRAVKSVGKANDRERDLALHEVRKKAKRLRYAAESSVPVLGKRAKALRASAKTVQQALGEHQDTVMSRQKLRELGARSHLGGQNGFTFGRLHGLEQARADAAVRRFEGAWKSVTTWR